MTAPLLKIGACAYFPVNTVYQLIFIRIDAKLKTQNSLTCKHEGPLRMRHAFIAQSVVALTNTINSR